MIFDDNWYNFCAKLWSNKKFSFIASLSFFLCSAFQILFTHYYEQGYVTNILSENFLKEYVRILGLSSMALYYGSLLTATMHISNILEETDV